MHEPWPSPCLGGCINNRSDFRHIITRHLAHLLHTINRCDAYTTNNTINEHLTGTTLTDATFEAARTTFEAVTMNREACLMQGGSYRLATLTTNSLSVVLKLYQMLLWNFENGMLGYLIHSVK